MKLASLILDIPSQALDGLYSYLVPEGMDEARVGCAAVVPFGHRLAIGFIVAIEEVEEIGLASRGLEPTRLKEIDRVASKPYFDDDGAACALYLARTCIAPLSSCIRLFTPPGGVPRVIRDGNGWRVIEPSVGEVDDRFVRLSEEGRSFEPRAGAVKQRSVIEALRGGELRVAELTMEFGPLSGVLSALEKRGVIEIEHRRHLRGFSPEDELRKTGEASRPDLTPGQETAVAAIGRAVDAGDGSTVLVDGVTGSGKTEVYLQAIEPLVEEGRRALVLVPEISLTPQTVSRFRGRFGNRVAVMHSRMSPGERYDQWDFIRSGEARVVVGARSALFTPIRDLALIIIDEEHEGSYKQDKAPRYHAREVASWLARRHGAALVLGSATPSIEALHACAKREDWTRAPLPERANGKPLPEVSVVDMAREFRDGSRSMFSARLSQELNGTLRRGEKAILLLNQRGFAKFVLCRDCGFVPECPHCATSLTYHEFEGRLICHHCDHCEPMPPRCPKCASPYLRKFGAGTQRVELELQALVSTFEGVNARIIRMDADTTRSKGAHRKLLESFAAPGAAVLLGTQMIAKGLDFEDVTLVGVINADTMLKLPDFRSAERTYDLIEQVAGRAGRAQLNGRVIVQTYWAEAAAIQAAVRHERALFLRDELPKRRALGYPPYVRMANILIWGKDEQAVRIEANRVYADLRAMMDDEGATRWMLLPATPCALSKLRGTHRWHIVVKAPSGEDIAGVLGPYFRKRPSAGSASVAVDIDPLSLL